MKTLHLILLSFVLVSLGTAMAQTKATVQPLTEPNLADTSCLEHEVASLRDAASATDLATAQLYRINADAYDRLNDFHQGCQ